MSDESGWMARLLPRRARRELFDPAWRDVQVRYGERSLNASRPLHRAALRLARWLAVAWLLGDCWRVVLTSRDAARSREWVSLSMWRQFRHAARMFSRERGVALGAASTLALGIGANVAVFGAVEAVLLRALPYPEADRLVIVQHEAVATGQTKDYVPIGDYLDLAARQSSFEEFGGYGLDSGTVTGLGRPFRASALIATDGAVRALRMQTMLGRGLEARDCLTNAPPVVVLSFDFWRDRLGSDPRVLGRHLQLGPLSAEIVGVAARGFRFPPETDASVVLPMTVPSAPPTSRTEEWTFIVARLKRGISLDVAAADLAAMSKQLALEHPADNQASRFIPVALRDRLVGVSRLALELALAVSTVVLIIACANVANILLARSLSRQRETAVRLALGAGRRHLAAQLFAESAVLAIPSTVVGVIAGVWATRGVLAMAPSSVSVAGLQHVQLNATVAAFGAVLAAATTIALAAVSGLTMRSRTPVGALIAVRSMGTPGARRTASAFVVIQLALAVTLLIGAGLVVRSLARLTAVHPGFEVDHVLTLHSSIPGERYRTRAALDGFYQTASFALRALPGVREVGTTAIVPLTGNHWTAPFEREDQRGDKSHRAPQVGWQSVSGGYFAALRIPLLSGRVFTDRDTPDSPPVVVISRGLEQAFFAAESAIGHRIMISRTNTAEIIGVVGDVRRASLAEDPVPDLYYASSQQPTPEMTWVIHTSGDPDQAVPAIRSALTVLEPGVEVTQARSMSAIAADSAEVLRFTMWLFGAFGGVALVLAAVGVYSVMAYATRQRAREIGIRTALGATRADLVGLVIREGLLLSGLGAIAGLLIGVLIARLSPLGALLYKTSPSDPMTLTFAPALLAVCALLACYLPARRAARIDPVRALVE